MKACICKIIIILGGGLWLSVSQVSANEAQAYFQQAEGFLKQEKYTAAIRFFQQAADLAGKQQQPRLQVEALLALAAAYQSHGLHHSALDNLNEAQLKVSQLDDELFKLAVYQHLGASLGSLGKFHAARDNLNVAVQSARTLDDPHLLALLLNALGSADIRVGDMELAEESFSEAVKIAEQQGDEYLSLMAGLNLLRLRIDQQQSGTIYLSLKKYSAMMSELDDNAEKAQLLLQIGDLYRRAHLQFETGVTWRKLAFQQYEKAGALANALQNKRLGSYAQAYIAKLYTDERRFEEAVYYTRRAVLLAQEGQDQLAEFRWQAQLARLLRAQGLQLDSLAAYSQAMSLEEKIRRQLLLENGGAFGRMIRPLANEYVEMLIEASEKIRERDVQQSYLSRAVAVMEQLHRAQISDYFHGVCNLQQRDNQQLLAEQKQTARVYPVLLNDRDSRFLVVYHNEIKAYRSPIAYSVAKDGITHFRKLMETSSKRDDYLRYSKSLYRWLFGAYDQELTRRQIDTVVMVADAQLKHIPFAALHDGSQFVLEKFAVVSSNGVGLLQLADKGARARMLLMGLVENSHEQITLAHVNAELNNLASLYDTSALRGSDFSYRKTKTLLDNKLYNIVHVASASQLGVNYQDSFIDSYDEQVSFMRLNRSLIEQSTEQALDLLVLSNAQIPVEHQGAADSLYSLPVATGARAVIASYWINNHISKAKLMTQFYQALTTGQFNKIQAFRKAQLDLLREQDTAHPHYWAGFAFLGNWM